MLIDAVTQEDSQSGVMVDSVQAVRPVCSEVRTPKRLSCDGDLKIRKEAVEFTPARKAAY